MKRFGRFDNGGHSLVVGFVFAAFLWALALSASPQLHQRVHGDANRGDHACVVTLIVSGNYDHTAPPPLISAPRSGTDFCEISWLSSTWVQPVILKSHVFAHAPPLLG
jgi:hypothetical protein